MHQTHGSPVLHGASSSTAAAVPVEGTIGIADDPAARLKRVRRSLAPDGAGRWKSSLPAEPRAARGPDETGGGAGPWFDWATVSCDDIDAVARSAGLYAGAVEARGGRWFAWLGRR
ncbi:MAG: hypothetical protein ACT4PW_04990 [Acidimicrobiia bacterium]